MTDKIAQNLKELRKAKIQNITAEINNVALLALDGTFDGTLTDVEVTAIDTHIRDLLHSIMAAAKYKPIVDEEGKSPYYGTMF